MRRRALLAAIGVSTLSVAGCLSDGPNGDGTDSPDPTDTLSGDSREADTPRYETCSREVIPYEQFPREIREEIDAALEGGHTADRIYLGDAMDTDRSYVEVGNAYYDPNIEPDGTRETLRLHAVEPKSLPRARPVTVENGRDGERTVTIEVVADDGTELLAEARTVHPGGEVEFGRLTRVGTHELQVTVADGESVETTAAIDESSFDVLVVADPEGVFVTGTVAELVPCRFEGSEPA